MDRFAEKRLEEACEVDLGSAAMHVCTQAWPHFLRPRRMSAAGLLMLMNPF